MQCKHFGECGSCRLYDQPYREQLEAKVADTVALWQPFSTLTPDVFPSPSDHYRARAEFRIWHTEGRCCYAMGHWEKRGVVLLEECPKVIDPIAERMDPLLELINGSKLLSHKLFGVEFLAATTGECLVTLLYHRRLEEDWQQEASRVASELTCRVIGRSRKQKVAPGETYVTEALPIDNQTYHYRHYEGGFTQPNPFVNIHMIEWAITQAKKVGDGDLLESYCGLGNFTIPLSRYFEKVLATEISKSSIRAAQENCRLNSAENIAFVRLSSAEMTQALNRERRFNRLEGVDLDTYRFSCVLVDPPRAGLDEATIALIAAMPAIIYISCSPETLVRDLATLTQTHTVEETALFDQFPYTHHIESGVFLRRR